MPARSVLEALMFGSGLWMYVLGVVVACVAVVAVFFRRRGGPTREPSPAPEDDWPQTFYDLAASPSVYMDPAAMKTFLKDLAGRIPDFQPPENLKDRDEVLSWSSRFGPRRFRAHDRSESIGVEAFLEAGDRSEGFPTSRTELAAACPTDEPIEAWRLLTDRSTETRRAFWFRDSTQKDRLRVIVVQADADGDYFADEFETAGALIGRAVIPNVLQTHPPSPIDDTIEPSLSHSLELPAPGPAAWRLVQAVDVVGGSAPIDIASRIAGIAVRDFRFAVSELEARGLARLRELPADESTRRWQRQAIEPLRAREEVSPYPEPEPEMEVRWSEMQEEPETVDRLRAAQEALD